jgi:acyl-CoA synthetase (AMP-forming)/AMP-acid ligase II
LNIPQRIREIVSLEPTAHAIQHAGRWTTFGDVRGTMDVVQGLLATRSPSRVGLLARNRTPEMCALLALLEHEHTVVMLDHLRTDDALTGDVNDLDLLAVVAGPELWERTSVIAAMRARGTMGLELGTGGDVRVVDPGSAGRPRPATPGVALEMLTSGTTGEAKRIPWTSLSLARAQESALRTWNGEAGTQARLRTGVVIVPVSIVHASGFANALGATLAGRRLALMERFDVDEWVRLVTEHRPLTAGLPPTALRMIFDREISPDCLSSLRVLRAGSAPLDPEFQRQFEERYGIPIITIYGATEFAAGTPLGWTLGLHEEWGDAKRGSVGRVMGGAEVRVVDSTSGVEVARGEVGLLELRAPFMEGIAGGGWVRTTDLAVHDEDDFVWIKGRADDVIIRGGFKVSLSKVQDVLLSHPDVAEVAVVDLPDERLGQVPAAAVVLRSDAAGVLESDLLAWCRARLARYEVPLRVALVDALPRTVALKIDAGEVRRSLAAVGQRDRN